MKIDSEEAEILIRAMACFYNESTWDTSDPEVIMMRSLIDKIEREHPGIVHSLYEGYLPSLLEDD